MSATGTAAPTAPAGPRETAPEQASRREAAEQPPPRARETAPEQASYREAARQLLRDRLLDAVRDLLERRPWAQITMADVAGAAGVSRQTLYNELGSREQLTQAFVIREGTRYVDAVERAIAANRQDPSGALAAALEVFLTAAADDPLIGMLRRDDGTGGLLPLLTTQSGPVLDWASDRLAEAMLTGWPQVSRDDASLLAAAIVRLAISYVTVPAGRPRQAAQDAVRLLGPFIERAVAPAGA